MKIDFKKIDLRQGKYWFPLVLFVPFLLVTDCMVSSRRWRITS